MHRVKDLSREQRVAVESLLGRSVSEDEAVSVKALNPSAIVPSRLTGEERKAALENLNLYFVREDAQREPVSREHEEAIIHEALCSTPPGYRPAS